MMTVVVVVAVGEVVAGREGGVGGHGGFSAAPEAVDYLSRDAIREAVYVLLESAVRARCSRPSTISSTVFDCHGRSWKRKEAAGRNLGGPQPC